MNIPALLTAIRGASAADIILYIIVLLLASRAGWIEIKRAKYKRNPNDVRHRSCVSQISTLVTEKNWLMMHSTLKDQKKQALDTLSLATRAMRDLFFKSLERKGKTAVELVGSIDVKCYNSAVETVSKRWTEDVFSMIDDNHFIEKEERELRDYIEAKWHQILETARIVFDTYYGGPELVISRAELHDLHRTLYPEMRQQFGNLIRSCRDIALRDQGKVKRIDEDIEAIREIACVGG